MGEIITISHSQFSGHVTTHLYNIQESLIPYTANTKLSHDLTTFLNRTPPPTGTSGVTYTPRSLLYDLRGGYGTLNKYEYHETMESLAAHVQLNTYTVSKSEYQLRLDAGEPPSKLTPANTKYWTDYTRLIFSPRSLQTITSYEYDTDKGHHYRFPRVSFDTFDKGAEEFKESFEDDEFRYFLEKCDLFTGLQVFTDLESAWAGYTSQWLTEITDEYFNKVDVWTFASTSSNDNSRSTLNRIKGIVELYKSSSLMFPLIDQIESPLVDYDSGSLWHRSAVHSVFTNSLWGLLNQIEDRETMTSIEDGLGGRKIANEIKIITTDASTATDASTTDGIISDITDISAYYAHPPPAPTNPEIHLGIQQESTGNKYFSKNLVVTKDYVNDTQQQPTPNIYINNSITNILGPDSFPSDILKFSKFHTEFNVHPGMYDQLKGYRQVVSRSNHPDLIKIVEDKSELVEDLSGIMEEYHWGEYDSDDDEFYD